MSDAWPSIKIRQFEHVTAGRSTSLLRVSGQPSRRRGTGDQRPTMLIVTERGPARFAPIPAPADPRGLLRAAYSVPEELVGLDSRYSLEHADGSLTELSQPTPGPGRSDGDSVGAQEAAPAAAGTEPAIAAPAPQARSPGAIRALTGSFSRAEREEGPQRAERRSDLLAQLAEQSEALAESERVAAQSDEARRLVEHELDQALDQLRAMTSERDELSRRATALDAEAVAARQRAAQAQDTNRELQATLQELDIWRGELERRLAATTTELGVAKAAREADQGELERLREALAGAAGRPDQGDDPDLPDGDAGAGESAQILAASTDPVRPISARLAALEAERAEIIRRAEELAELARAPADPDPSRAGAALISERAERSAREQAQRELDAATSAQTDR